MKKRFQKLPKWLRVVLWVFVIFVALLGYFFGRPFFDKKTQALYGLNITYPFSWYITSSDEGFIISDVHGNVSMQAAPVEGTGIEIRIGLAPKDSLDSYLKNVTLYNSDSKITHTVKNINGHSALLINLSNNKTSFFSKEIMVFVEDKDFVYRIDGGTLRWTGGSLVEGYLFGLVKQVFDSIRINPGQYNLPQTGFPSPTPLFIRGK